MNRQFTNHIFLPDTDPNYLTIYKQDSQSTFLLSKQHKTIIYVDKLCMWIFLFMLPFIVFLDDTSHPYILVIYHFVLGLMAGKSINIFIFHILAQSCSFIAVLYVLFLLFISI